MRVKRTHGEVLKASGFTTRGCVARILAVWDLATPADGAAGEAWYGNAASVASDLAVAGGITIECAAAVIAQMSPRTSWSRNVSGAFLVVLTGDASMCLGENVKRARAALESDRPMATLNGPKVRAFANNILGNRDAVTVDVWAARIALGSDANHELILGRAGVYDAIAHCFRIAAARRGVDPVTMQATTWVVARGSAS